MEKKNDFFTTFKGKDITKVKLAKGKVLLKLVSSSKLTLVSEDTFLGGKWSHAEVVNVGEGTEFVKVGDTVLNANLAMSNLGLNWQGNEYVLVPESTIFIIEEDGNK